MNDIEAERENLVAGAALNGAYNTFVEEVMSRLAQEQIDQEFPS